MDSGDTFTPDGLTKDTELIEDFYGSKGYIEISEGQALHVNNVPNVETGTMDLDFSSGTVKNPTSKKSRSVATSRPRTRSSAANWRFPPATSSTWCTSRSASSGWKVLRLFRQSGYAARTD